MLSRILHIRQGEYPPQFWLLFWGMGISTLGMSMIWPFLMIYVSEKLQLPMVTAASLMSISALASLVAAFIAGPFADKVGRKGAMVFSLFASGLGYLLMVNAETYTTFAILMALRGAVQPLYKVGADAMIADLVPTEQRADAYALMRMSDNAGIALGPAIGGFIAGVSYNIAFFIAAGGLGVFAALIALFARETKPDTLTEERGKREVFAGYERVLTDRPFVSFVFSFMLTQVCATLVWVLLGVYAKQNYGLPERLYGFIPMTNALMVVFMQVWVTNRTKSKPPLRVLFTGGLLYAFAVSSIAWGNGFLGFWLSMVVLTLGELMLVPTATTFAANLAPVDMRGRYMSIYALTWTMASGVGPLLGGYLNDAINPQATWYGGGLIGLVGALSFLYLARREKQPANHPYQPKAPYDDSGTT